MTDLEIINLIYQAIELAGDGGPSPFTHDEYKAMDNFLNKIKNICEIEELKRKHCDEKS